MEMVKLVTLFGKIWRSNMYKPVFHTDSLQRHYFKFIFSHTHESDKITLILCNKISLLDNLLCLSIGQKAQFLVPLVYIKISYTLRIFPADTNHLLTYRKPCILQQILYSIKYRTRNQVKTVSFFHKCSLNEAPPYIPPKSSVHSVCACMHLYFFLITAFKRYNQTNGKISLCTSIAAY